MAILAPIQHIMDTKDRIKQIMEDQKMTQQLFADFLQQSPATLSSIFNGRTRPTLNIVDAIKAKIPDISIEWLLYGSGDMYVSHPDVCIKIPILLPIISRVSKLHTQNMSVRKYDWWIKNLVV